MRARRNAPRVKSTIPVVHYRTVEDRRRRHLLSRGRPDGRPGRAAAARLSDLVAHVPQPDPGACRPLPCDRAGLPRLRRERRARSQGSSPTRSTTTPTSWTALLGAARRRRSYAIYVMDYGAPVGYRLALKHPGAGRRRSSSRTATPTRRGSRPSGTRSRPIGRTDREAHREAHRRPGRAGDHEVPVHRRRRATSSRIDPGQLGPRPAAARPPGQQGHPARPLPTTTAPTCRSTRNSRRSSASASRRR